MKKLLLLNTSIVINKNIFSKDPIKLEYGKNRIESYIKGFEALKKVSIFDIFDNKLEFAKKVGATHTINSKIDNPIEACLEITDGRGVDCAIESAGHNETIRQTLECSRPGARIVILGKTPYGVEINLPFYTLMGEREIIRTSYGKSHPRIDFPRLANLYMDGKLYLDEMITKTYKLEEINEGFDALERGELARGLVIF